MKIELPYPPTINHYYVRTRRGVILGEKGRAYRAEVCHMLASLGFKAIEGPVVIEIVVHPPDKRKRDIDNILKALLDALEHAGAFENDNQIVRLTIEKRMPVKGGRALITIQGEPGPPANDDISLSPSELRELAEKLDAEKTRTKEK